jgi:site-specific recombinase XerD
MGAPEIEDFLTMLVSVRHISASTHKQALSGILFFYNEVLQIDPPWMQQIGRPKTEQRLPTVLTALEVQSVFGNLELFNAEHALFAKLLYVTDMRIMEAARLRIKDIEFDQSAIIIHEGKGSKDRVVMLPESIQIDLMAQVARCKLRWQSDTEHQMSGVEMPFALDVKYPRAGHSLAWF